MQNLQALNNPFVAAANNASQKPASLSTLHDITPATSSTTTSVTGAQSYPGHQFYENIHQEKP